MEEKKHAASEKDVNVLMGELCPVCNQKTLSLAEREEDIPYFGRVALFSMTCNECKFHKADVESLEQRQPVKLSIEVSGENDMQIRVVKSSNAIVKIPYIANIEPGEASNGYVTNVEGLLKRVKKQVEAAGNADDDPAVQKKSRKLLKKINRIIWGEEKTKLIIEDPSGNSAIISDKATSSKLKTSK